jgi:hypothetical protein
MYASALCVLLSPALRFTDFRFTCKFVTDELLSDLHCATFATCYSFCRAMLILAIFTDINLNACEV